MASDFEVFGLDELIECFEALIDKWEEKKVVLLNKIGNILDSGGKAERESQSRGEKAEKRVT